jgi:hypothetical protein
MGHRASLLAMRRISWTDQRISSLWLVFSVFWGRHVIGAVSDRPNIPSRERALWARILSSVPRTAFVNSGV